MDCDENLSSQTTGSARPGLGKKFAQGVLGLRETGGSRQGIQPDEHHGFAALQDNRPVGLVTYRIEGDQCEITILNSLVEGVGIGSALIDVVRDVAINEQCKRLVVITTNDNTPALRFYQKRGFVLVAIYRNAVEKARKLKTEIPQTGVDGIPLRDEIELELLLQEGLVR